MKKLLIILSMIALPVLAASSSSKSTTKTDAMGNEETKTTSTDRMNDGSKTKTHTVDKKNAQDGSSVRQTKTSTRDANESMDEEEE